MKRLGALVPHSPVLYATILFLVVSALIEPRSLQAASLNSMLPFAAVLAVVAVGQTLVVQQRGVDLSVAGTVTLSAIIVSKIPHGDDALLLPSIAVALVVGAAIGAVIGLVVTVMRVTPLIATFGMNAVVTGIVVAYAGGQSDFVPPALNAFATGRLLGIHHLVWFAVAFTLVTALVMGFSAFGRRFDAVGANIDAARASGLRVLPTRWSAYVIASVCYATAGVLIAGFVNVPDLSVGANYVMPSIAAVVLGGTSFAGGRGRLIGTMIAALLLSQLNQFVLSIGAPTSVQLIVQGVVIAIAAAAQAPLVANLMRRLRPSARVRAEPAVEQTGSAP